MYYLNYLTLLLLSATRSSALSLPSAQPTSSSSSGQVHAAVKPIPWGNETTLGEEVHWLPGEPAATNDVVFEWCRDGEGGCDGAELKHGRCYDLSMLDGLVRARLSSVGAQGGRCMLFQNHDCSGEHTATFTGEGHWTEAICRKSKVDWSRQAAGVRCCAGEPEDPWCNVAIKKTDRCARG